MRGTIIEEILHQLRANTETPNQKSPTLPLRRVIVFCRILPCRKFVGEQLCHFAKEKLYYFQRKLWLCLEDLVCDVNQTPVREDFDTVLSHHRIKSSIRRFNAGLDANRPYSHFGSENLCKPWQICEIVEVGIRLVMLILGALLS
jgi:hypothetical protein